MAAISELNRMKLAPALDVAKIEKMKKEIPDINTYTEFTGEKPLGKPKPDQFQNLPSPGAMEATKTKVMRKANELLRR